MALGAVHLPGAKQRPVPTGAGAHERDRLSPSPTATRDYFKIHDAAGRWLWVFRELETRRWFVHGQWV